MSWFPKTGDRAEFTYSEGCFNCGKIRVYTCAQVFTDRGEWLTLETTEVQRHSCSTNESSDERN